MARRSSFIGLPTGVQWLNPLAAILSPIQLRLGILLVRVRAIKRLVTWFDRQFSLIIVAALLGSSLLLAAVGYLLSLLPWGLIIEWLFRLCGLVLFGPHMHFVGLKVKSERQQYTERAEHFDQASDSERAIILKEYEQELLDKSMHASDAQYKRTAPSDTLCQRYALLKIYPDPTLGRLKFICQPDLTRSAATPMVATGLISEYAHALSWPWDTADTSSGRSSITQRRLSLIHSAERFLGIDLDGDGDVGLKNGHDQQMKRGSSSHGGESAAEMV